MLLILRDNRPDIPNPNSWTRPGGRLDEQETPDQGMARECQEEISLVPQDLHLIGIEDEKLIFLARLTDEEAKIVKLGNEGQKLDFFTLPEAAQLNVSSRLNHEIKSYGSAIQKLLEGDNVEPEELGLEPAYNAY
jgi:8-oxo-dGTP diphosphatase